jgi:hypothetical protein
MRFAFAALLLAALFGTSGTASAAVSAEEAGSMIAEAYGVEVLQVREGEIDSRPVWLVVTMVPGGNSNAAFMVSTLAVDRDTGEIVPSFRHGPSLLQVPPTGSGFNLTEEAPVKVRTRVWR